VLLDARDITGGPVARVVMPRRLPFGFHGNWMPDS
jgi:carotenoid cleavage dioxygenase